MPGNSHMEEDERDSLSTKTTLNIRRLERKGNNPSTTLAWGHIGAGQDQKMKKKYQKKASLTAIREGGGKASEKTDAEEVLT